MALLATDFASRGGWSDTTNRQTYNTANGGFTLTATPGSGNYVYVYVMVTDNTAAAQPSDPVVTVAGVTATKIDDELTGGRALNSWLYRASGAYSGTDISIDWSGAGETMSDCYACAVEVTKAGAGATGTQASQYNGGASGTITLTVGAFEEGAASASLLMVYRAAANTVTDEAGWTSLVDEDRIIASCVAGEDNSMSIVHSGGATITGGMFGLEVKDTPAAGTVVPDRGTGRGLARGIGRGLI